MNGNKIAASFTMCSLLFLLLAVMANAQPAAQPTVATISPTTVVAGGAAFTLTVTGTNFTSDSQVFFGNTFLVTTYGSSTSLTAAVTANEIANPIRVNVGVSNGPRSYSNVIPFAVLNPNAPTVSSLSSTTAVAGSAAFTLTVTGTNFTSSSQVFFGDALLSTSFVSSTSLTAQVTTGDIAFPRNVMVGVTNGAKEYSNFIKFSITPPPMPTISSISPTTVVAGSPEFTLTVTGTNFTSASQVFFGKALLTTTFGSSTSLTASVPATAIANASKVNVGVTNGQGIYSNLIPFDIANPNAPMVTGLSPTTIVAEGPDFTLTVTGTNFTSASQVFFGDALLKTTFVSATSLTATVPAGAIAGPRTVNVGVTNGPKNYSNLTQFAITPAPAPIITSLSPDTAVAGGAAFTLTVNGANFTRQSKIFFGFGVLQTTYVSATQLTATVPSQGIDFPGMIPVVVGNGPRNYSVASQFNVTPATATVEYFLGRSGAANDDGIVANYNIAAGGALDMTQPASVTLEDPAVGNSPDTLVFQTGSVTLTEEKSFPGSNAQFYTYKTKGLVLAVACWANNVYSVNLQTIGLGLTSTELSAAVTLTVNLGGQTFSIVVTPTTQKI